MTENPWEPDGTGEFDGLSTEDRISAAIDRLRRFHEETGYGASFHKPLIAADGASESEIGDLEAEVGGSLPAEYRAFLRRFRHVELYDGFSIWGPDGTDARPWLDTELVPGRRLLACGDAWREADGDSLMLDMDSGAVSIWSHDFRALRPLAPSFSLGFARLVAYLVPGDEEWDDVVATLRASHARESAQKAMPWWRRIFGSRREP